MGIRARSSTADEIERHITTHFTIKSAKNAAMLKSTSASVAAQNVKGFNIAALISAFVAPARASSRVSGQKLQQSVSFRCRAEKEDWTPTPIVEDKPQPEESKMTEEEEFDKKWNGPAMGFAGWAPEVINGRLAMVGILAGLGAEFAKGESIPTQFADHFGAFFFASALVIAASFVPGIGNPAEMKKNDGMWTANAEMLNGHVAMVALALTIAVEAFTNSALL